MDKEIVFTLVIIVISIIIAVILWYAGIIRPLGIYDSVLLIGAISAITTLAIQVKVHKEVIEKIMEVPKETGEDIIETIEKVNTEMKDASEEDEDNDTVIINPPKMDVEPNVKSEDKPDIKPHSLL